MAFIRDGLEHCTIVEQITNAALRMVLVPGITDPSVSTQLGLESLESTR